MIKALLAVFVALGIAIGAVAAAPHGAIALSGGPGTHICTNPNYTSSSPSSEHGYTTKDGTSYVVSADVWNDVNIKETMSECAQNSWSDTAQATGTAVQQYANTNVTYGPDKTVASYASLTSNFRDGPLPVGSGLDYESAYDIWLGPQTEWTDASQHTEMMIWTDTDGQVPAGSVVATTTINGRAFKVWFAGGIGQSNGDIVTYESVKNYTFDQTDLTSFFDDAASRDYLEAGTSTYLWQIDYGYEICAAPAGSVFSVEAFNVKDTVS